MKNSIGEAVEWNLFKGFIFTMWFFSFIREIYWDNPQCFGKVIKSPLTSFHVDMLLINKVIKKFF